MQVVWYESMRYSQNYSSSKLEAFTIESGKDGTFDNRDQDFFNRDKSWGSDPKVKTPTCGQLKYLPLKRSLTLNGLVLWELQRLQWGTC